MTEAMENLILEHLKSLRSELKDVRTGMQADFAEVKHRLNQIEGQGLRARGDTAAVQEDVYRQQGVIDGMKERLDRIERRLELTT